MERDKRDSRVIHRYSEAFKAQVVREYEAGEFKGLAEAHRKYGIRGNGTVARWLKAHGKEHLMRKVVRVEAVGEADRVAKLEMEVKRLKLALGGGEAEDACRGGVPEAGVREGGPWGGGGI